MDCSGVGEVLPMFDIWIGDMNASFLIYMIAVVVWIAQILLCFLAKNRAVRLIPVILCGIAAAACLIMAPMASGWDGLGWIVFAAYAGFLLSVCALGWGIWGLWKLLQRIWKKRQTNASI